MNASKDNIINLFYNEHLKVKEIAEIENVVPSYITEIIKQDKRYEEEKQYRKDITKSNKKVLNRNHMQKVREQRRIDDSYSFAQEQHRQAVCELSKGKHISNDSFRKWNSSSYHYNPSKHRYEYDSTLVRCYSVPKYIKERY